jgi:hypothetical protein
MVYENIFVQTKRVDRENFNPRYLMRSMHIHRTIGWKRMRFPTSLSRIAFLSIASDALFVCTMGVFRDNVISRQLSFST